MVPRVLFMHINMQAEVISLAGTCLSISSQKNRKKITLFFYLLYVLTVFIRFLLIYTAFK